MKSLLPVVVGLFMGLSALPAAGQEQPAAQEIVAAAVQHSAFVKADAQARLAGLRTIRARQLGQGADIELCKGMAGTPAEPPSTDYQGYYNNFGATLNVAASFGDTGASGIPSAKNTIDTETLGQIEFESEHFFYNYKRCLSRRPTFSFGGLVGLQPALVMENLTSMSATIAIPKNRPMFQDAFGWNLIARMNVATSQLSQVAAFADFGGKYLISQVSSFKQGDDTIVATPVANQVGQSATYWETGVEWKYLNTPIANAYLNKTDVLTPPFAISVGYKHDNRFNRAGDLAGFSSPEARFFFRFTVGLNKIKNWSTQEVEPSKGYTFKFGIDYEKPVSDSKMPVSTRYYVSGNFDINKIFKPSNP